MRNAKFGAHCGVGRRRRTSTSPAADATHEETKPSVVIGSSSSGSYTPPSAASACARRLTPAPPTSSRRPGPAAGIGEPEALGHVDAVELRGVEAEDLLLALDAEPRVVREVLVVGHLPVDEALDLPLRLPDGVVAAEEHLVLADPEQQLAHDLGEEPRARVHQAADHHRQAGVDVALLRRHEAEVLDPRQPDVLDDEVELLVVGRDVVDVGDVEGVLVQRPDRRALVDVDVLDPELDALVEERHRLGVGQLPAARALVPLGGVELDALEAVLRVIGLELAQAGLAFTRVPAAIEDQAVP